MICRPDPPIIAAAGFSRACSAILMPDKLPRPRRPSAPRDAHCFRIWFPRRLPGHEAGGRCKLADRYVTDMRHDRSHNMTIITRRRLLTSAAGAAALPFVTDAFAQGRLTVTSYGGTWEKAQREIYAPVFKAKNAGWDVDVQLGGPPQWLSQIEANASAPPIHVSLMPVELALAGGAKGLFEKVSVEKVPNLADVPKPFIDMCEGWGVCVNYGAAVFGYHKERVKNPPKSYKELVERVAKGELHAALPGIGWA